MPTPYNVYAADLCEMSVKVCVHNVEYMLHGNSTCQRLIEARQAVGGGHAGLVFDAEVEGNVQRVQVGQSVRLDRFKVSAPSRKDLNGVICRMKQDLWFNDWVQFKLATVKMKPIRLIILMDGISFKDWLLLTQSYNTFNLHQLSMHAAEYTLKLSL